MRVDGYSYRVMSSAGNGRRQAGTAVPFKTADGKLAFASAKHVFQSKHSKGGSGMQGGVIEEYDGSGRPTDVRIPVKSAGDAKADRAVAVPIDGASPNRIAAQPRELVDAGPGDRLSTEQHGFAGGKPDQVAKGGTVTAENGSDLRINVTGPQFNHGNSGGPLFIEGTNQVAAIVSRGTEGTGQQELIGVSTPAPVMNELAEQARRQPDPTGIYGQFFATTQAFGAGMGAN